MEDFTGAVGVIMTGLLFGTMVSFAGFFAPMAFRRLHEDVASDFVRDIFPGYYMMCLVLAVTAAVNLAANPERTFDAGAMGFVAVGFAAARWWLMPVTQRLYDAREAGEYGAADRFASIHRRGAFLNMVQILICLVVLARYAV